MAAKRLETLGPDSVGYLWPVEEEEPLSDSEDEGEDPFEHPRNKRLLQLGRSLSNLSSSTDSLSTLSAASSSAPSSPMSDASDASLPNIPTLSLDAVPPAFHVEASASLARAFVEGHSVENAMLELRTLVMGYNAGVDRAREEVTTFLMSKIDVSSGVAAGVLKSATTIWSRWGTMAAGLAPDLTNIALDVQGYCVQHDEYAAYFGIILRALYETDVLGEEDLTEWRSLSAARGEGTKDGKEKKVWVDVFGKGKVYVDVLEQMESESEDGEGDEEEDDDE